MAGGRPNSDTLLGEIRNDRTETSGFETFNRNTIVRRDNSQDIREILPILDPVNNNEIVA